MGYAAKESIEHRSHAGMRGSSASKGRKTAQMVIYVCLITTLFFICVLPQASGWEVAPLQPHPVSVDAGSTVSIEYLLTFPSGGDAIPKTHAVVLRTELLSPEWSCRIAIDGEEQAMEMEAAQEQLIPGALLSVEGADEVEVQIGLKGIVPASGDPAKILLLEAQEYSDQGEKIGEGYQYGISIHTSASTAEVSTAAGSAEGIIQETPTPVPTPSSQANTSITPLRTVSAITTPPPVVMAGEALNLEYVLTFPSIDGVTFTDNHTLELRTDLTSPAWEYRILADGLELLADEDSEEGLLVPGMLLSIEGADEVELEIALKGRVPLTSASDRIALLEVREFNDRGDEVGEGYLSDAGYGGAVITMPDTTITQETATVPGSTGTQGAPGYTIPVTILAAALALLLMRAKGE